jgi:hypothetical protein
MVPHELATRVLAYRRWFHSICVMHLISATRFDPELIPAALSRPVAIALRLIVRFAVLGRPLVFLLIEDRTLLVAVDVRKYGPPLDHAATFLLAAK